MKYQIYQIKRDLLTQCGFLGLDMMKNLNRKIEIELENYNIVYEGELNEDKIVNQLLEKLFYIFNVEHPKDFEGRSMSVSDIVKLDDKYYFCDSIGWKKIDF